MNTGNWSGVEEMPRSAQVGEMLAEVIDPRLAEVWVEIFSAPEDELRALMPWLLRMAYLCGHRDAQEAPDALTDSLGVRDARRTP